MDSLLRAGALRVALLLYGRLAFGNFSAADVGWRFYCCDVLIRRGRLGFTVAVTRADTSHFLNGSRYPTKRRAEIRKINEGQQEACHPENMHMGEKGNETKNRNDLELHLL